MSSQSRSWAPHPGLVTLSWILFVLAAGGVFLIDDTPGRVLIGVAVAVLLLAALFGTIARPRLAVDATGVTLRNLFGRRHWDWSQINVRLARTRRLGRDMPTIELDADPDLIVLGWYDLGTDPVDVMDEIRAIRT
jgi:hypothetical protein